MDVNVFVLELTRALSTIELRGQMALQTDGPISQGYIYMQQDVFVRFYFNQVTQTIAFALIKEDQRVWGIDQDRPPWLAFTLSGKPDSSCGDCAPIGVRYCAATARRINELGLGHTGLAMDGGKLRTHRDAQAGNLADGRCARADAGGRIGDRGLQLRRGCDAVTVALGRADTPVCFWRVCSRWDRQAYWRWCEAVRAGKTLDISWAALDVCLGGIR